MISSLTLLYIFLTYVLMDNLCPCLTNITHILLKVTNGSDTNLELLERRQEEVHFWRIPNVTFWTVLFSDFFLGWERKRERIAQRVTKTLHLCMHDIHWRAGFFSFETSNLWIKKKFKYTLFKNPLSIFL